MVTLVCNSLSKPQRQAGALTADVLSVIRLTAPKPRARGRGLETAALTWGDVQRWDDGSGRITVVRSKTGALA